MDKSELKDICVEVLTQHGISVPNPQDVKVQDIFGRYLWYGNLCVQLNANAEAIEKRGVGLAEDEHYLTRGKISSDGNVVTYTITVYTPNNRE